MASRGARSAGQARRRCADPQDEELARSAAIALLARRDLTQRALTERLERTGFARETAAHAVAVLAEERLVDDLRYAAHAVASRRARGQGPLRIKAELLRQGLAATLVEHALREAEIDWTECARALKRRHFGAAPARSQRDRSRQMRFLCQRGYTLAQARAAVGGRSEPDEADAELAWTDPDHVDLPDAP
jgi:regulatory protein